MAPRIQNAVHHLDRSQLQFTFLPFEHAQGYISCKGSYGDPAPIDILSTGSHSLAGLFWIRWDMHSLNWIHRISSAQTDAADVISQRLPTPNDAWLPIIHVKHYTLVFVVDKNNGKILLGYKKRGMGMHLWNGFGGKPDADESMEACAKRELEEEAGLTEPSLTYKGQFVITDSNGPIREGSDTSALIWIYLCDRWKGDPIETEEMTPKWFRSPSIPTTKNASQNALEDIPVDSIWPEQRFFLPELLDMTTRQEMYGRVDYDTLPARTAPSLRQEEDQLVTKDKTHRLKAWQFVRVRAGRSDP